MSLPELVVPAASVATVGVTLRYGSDALIRLIAGITAIMAKDKARAERALKVLRTLRRGSDQQPDP